MRLHIGLITRAVTQKDNSLYSRVLRQIVILRKQLRYETLVSICKPYMHALESDPLKFIKPVLVCLRCTALPTVPLCTGCGSNPAHACGIEIGESNGGRRRDRTRCGRETGKRGGRACTHRAGAIGQTEREGTKRGGCA